jgi:hypothetical protein
MIFGGFNKREKMVLFVAKAISIHLIVYFQYCNKYGAINPLGLGSFLKFLILLQTLLLRRRYHSP